MADPKPIITRFSYCDSGHAADILEGAALVTCFLRETAPAFSDGDVTTGLSENGRTGLHLILCGVENSIRVAIDRL